MITEQQLHDSSKSWCRALQIMQHLLKKWTDGYHTQKLRDLLVLELIDVNDISDERWLLLNL